jgi:hypothetical protein
MATSILSIPLVILPVVLGAAAPAPAQEANAWAVWTSWPRDSISELALDTVRMVEPSAELSLELIRKEGEAREPLEEATERLRRGLAQPSCSAPGTEGIVSVVELGETVAFRALVAGVQGERSGPLLTELLAASRRAARCEGSLLSFEIGRTLEKRTLYVLWWLGERRLLSAEEAQALGAVLARDALSSADIAKAVAHEERLVRAQLPVSPDIEPVWSRAQTEALLAQRLAGLRAALEKGKVDWKAEGETASRLIDKEDEKYLLAVKVFQPGDMPAQLGKGSQVPLPARPNVIGRFLVRAILQSLLPVVERASGEIQRRRGELQVLRAGLELSAAGERGPRPKPGVDVYGSPIVVDAKGVRSRGPDRIEGSEDDIRFTPRGKPQAAATEAPREEGFGSCSQAAPGRYVLDALAVRRFEASGQDAAMAQARIVPHVDQGVTAGFRLLAIKQGSLPDTCGFKSGDLLTQLNGQALTDPGKALTAIESVKKARRAAFRIMRQGGWVELLIEAPAR